MRDGFRESNRVSGLERDNVAGLRVKTLFHPNGEIRVLPEQASTLPVRSYGGARAVVTRCRWEARSAAETLGLLRIAST